MSRNAVDAIIRAAYARRQKMMIIASRSQIECGELGGGYVENWSSHELAEYVRTRDPESLVMLCRDHGGPWQHPDDGLEMEAATVMRRAALSMRADVDAGFGLIHIDTSRERGTQAPLTRALERLFTLYGETQSYADDNGRSVLFEIGIEQQAQDADDPAVFSDQVTQMLHGLQTRGLRCPSFVVGQTGTHVRGTSNDGRLVDEPDRVLSIVRQLSSVCTGLGTALKAHNADYLSDRSIRRLFAAGVHAVNVAPELGVVETRLLLHLLERFKMDEERDRFIALAHNSRAWTKWVDEDAGDVDRAVVAGHYVFATSVGREVRHRIEDACKRYQLSLDRLIGERLDQTVGRYALAYPN